MTSNNSNTAPQAGTLTDPKTQREMANAIRALSMDAVQQANSGHPGAPMAQRLPKKSIDEPKRSPTSRVG